MANFFRPDDEHQTPSVAQRYSRSVNTKHSTNAPGKYPPLSEETRSHVTTAHAAYLLCREQNTIRIWAMRKCGPVLPVKVGGRLAWPVADIRKLLSD